MRLTVAQATVRFLTVQYIERDGTRDRFMSGCLGIFGHGNVAGLGLALLENQSELPYYLARNEQAMVHTAVGFARMSNRLRTFACTSSVGPGALNMVTGAAVATTNRIPVLLLPGDVFATRRANPVLQELEDPSTLDISVNDCLRPVSRYFDRVWRPEQLPAALMHAMRVLTDPAETGAVTLALPEDVQTEVADFPDELFATRVWSVRRPRAESRMIDRVEELIRSSSRPMMVAGGGVIYSGATDELATFALKTGIPVAETQAGKGSLRFDHPASLGAIGSTGTTAANSFARRADLVIGIGTRWSDFTTASNSAFQHPSVRFVNVNVSPFDSTKLSGLPVVSDAREFITALTKRMSDWRVESDYETEVGIERTRWNAAVVAAYAESHLPVMAQGEVIGLVEASTHDGDVVVGAAGSLPGDLHKLWRARDPKGYHVEYAFSCMGYEIAAGLGVKMASPEREVYVMVGDGSYLMMSSELATAVQERLKLIVILVVNHGFQSIGALSESVGVERFGTIYRSRSVDGRLDGALTPTDLALNAESYGVQVLRVATREELGRALAAARSHDLTTVIHVETNPSIAGPDSESWWDVPVAESSSRLSAREARLRYEAERKIQRSYLAPAPITDAS